jgi:archaeosine-15-forming tRNA-guanine transglycosylase
MVEIWKDIEGYENIYQVSNLGRIRRVNQSGYRIRKQKVNKGYFLITLSKDAIQKTFLVHRLVGLAFVDNPKMKPEINHLDENKLNNRANNLQWVTSKENANWGTRNSRISEYVRHNPVSVCKTKRVNQICKDTKKIIATYESMGEVVRKFGYHQGNISECCSGKRREANGFLWSYA